MSKSKINVIKIPNEKAGEAPPTANQAQFPRMPRMYLELIENKDKIKPNMVNKEYDPDEVATVMSERTGYKEPLQESQKLSRLEESDEEDVREESDEEDDRQESDEEEASEKSSQPNDREEDDDDVDRDEEDDEDENEDDENDNEEDEFEEESPFPRENREGFEKILQEDDERSSVRSGVSSIALSTEENRKKNETREKLREILKDPPKLSDLEKRGEVKSKHVVGNLGPSSMEEEDELKRELLYKFELLKRGYKNVDIPEFNMHSDYKNMNKTYENTLRRVSLDSNVESYRNYLIAGFMLMEYILGFWLKFDMAGFTQQQILNMNQYERLLIELGEKSYVPDDRKWPVEVRLLGMIIMNAVIFIVAKMIMTKTGTSLFGLMNSQQTEFQKHKAKRKMKGPNIDISTIPDIQENV